VTIGCTLEKFAFCVRGDIFGTPYTDSENSGSILIIVFCRTLWVWIRSQMGVPYSGRELGYRSIFYSRPSVQRRQSKPLGSRLRDERKTLGSPLRNGLRLIKCLFWRSLRITLEVVQTIAKSASRSWHRSRLCFSEPRSGVGSGLTKRLLWYVFPLGGGKRFDDHQSHLGVGSRVGSQNEIQLYGPLKTRALRL
jgi:hypothetical protein